MSQKVKFSSLPLVKSNEITDFDRIIILHRDGSDLVNRATEIHEIKNLLSTDFTASIALYADTANYANTAGVANNVYISSSGQNVVFGNVSADVLTANTLNVTETNRSILYASGSTKFGDTTDDRHDFTGSISLSGSSFTWNGERLLVSSDSSSLTADSASYIDWSGVDNVPDFILESETGSMSVATASYISWTNVDGEPDIAATASQVFNDSDVTGDNVRDALNSLSSSLSSIGTDTTSSYVDYVNVANKPTLVSGSSQLSSDISGSFVVASSSIAVDINNLQIDSGSFSTRVTDLENFSSSLDNIYISASGQDVIFGNLTADIVTVNELYVTSTTRSVLYESGSSNFGDSLDDVHSYTGSVNITGSLSLNGFGVLTDEFTASLSVISSSYTQTASFAYSSSNAADAFHADQADIALTALNAITSSYSQTSSFVEYNNVVNKPTLISSSAQIAGDISGSFVEASSSFSTRVTDLETFSSSLDNIYISASGQNITVGQLTGSTALFTGNVAVQGTLNVNELVITELTRSIIYESGSTIFGDSLDDIHQYTGSLYISGSGFQWNGNTVVTSDLTSSLSVTTASYAHTASYAYSASNAVDAFHADQADISLTALNANTASVALTSITASHIEYSNISNKPTLISSSAQIAGDISGSYINLSSSLQTRVSDLEDFSSSLDNIYISASGQNVVFGNLTADVVTANELYVTSTTRSVIYESGSSTFGDTLDDEHRYTGSLYITGSEFQWNGNTVVTSELTSSLSVTTASYAHTASYAYSASNAVDAFHADQADIALTALNANSSSVAVTASYLIGLDNIYISASGQDVSLGTGNFTTLTTTGNVNVGNDLYIGSQYAGVENVEFIGISSYNASGSFVEIFSLNNANDQIVFGPWSNDVVDRIVFNAGASANEIVIDSANESYTFNQGQLNRDFRLYKSGSNQFAYRYISINDTHAFSGSSFTFNGDPFLTSSDIYISGSGQDVVFGNVTADILTANEMYITSTTRSVIYESGSTAFGDTIDDTHTFTGSVNITGSSFKYNGNHVIT